MYSILFCMTCLTSVLIGQPHPFFIYFSLISCSWSAPCQLVLVSVSLLSLFLTIFNQNASTFLFSLPFNQSQRGLWLAKSCVFCRMHILTASNMLRSWDNNSSTQLLFERSPLVTGQTQWVWTSSILARIRVIVISCSKSNKWLWFKIHSQNFPET